MANTFEYSRTAHSIKTRKCSIEIGIEPKVIVRLIGNVTTHVDRIFHSSTNANKWQEELQILRNNNAKLTTALQESHANVEEWKRQLQFYRDECSRLRQLVRTKH